MNKTILIIEDELKIRFLLRDYLKSEGFNVLEASDGDEGIFVFKNNNKDELEVALKNALDLKIKYNIIDDWNYAQYLKKFRNAVKNICKK